MENKSDCKSSWYYVYVLNTQYGSGVVTHVLPIASNHGAEMKIERVHETPKKSYSTLVVAVAAVDMHSRFVRPQMCILSIDVVAFEMNLKKAKK